MTSGNSSSTSAGGKKNKGKKSGKKSAPRTAAPFQRKLDPFITPGGTVKEFLSDKRLSEQHVTAVITEMTTVLTFDFKVKDNETLKMKSLSLSQEKYMSWRADRAMQLQSTNKEEAWLAFLVKVQTRTAFESSADLVAGLPVPEVKGKPAQAVVLSVLTPLEKDLLTMSQKNWNLVDAARLKETIDGQRAKITPSLLKSRYDYVATRFSGQPADSPVKPGHWESMGMRHMPQTAVCAMVHPINQKDGAAISEAAMNGASESSDPSTKKEKKKKEKKSK